ncbi:MAG TPA: F0F1 ATP synthase subunit epsilon [Candidatus Microsaccharimonas sp.]|nr:F0F1 ATP synthase subunit epsilon [Candidatus Microsaccharimonas sp.]
MGDDEKKDGEPIESQIETGKNMALKVYSPYKVYFEGLAASVSAESKTGEFDILPKHHNFITLLEPCDLTIRVEGQDDQIIPINGGIMHVKADQVTVFLDI